MKLTIYYDGQFYVGIIEVTSGNTLKAYRHIFGSEPKDQEVLEFVNRDLLKHIEKHDQKGITIQNGRPKKIILKDFKESSQKK